MSNALQFFNTIFDEIVEDCSDQCNKVYIIEILNFVYSYVKDTLDQHKFQPNKFSKNGMYKHDENKIDICRKDLLKMKNLLEQSEESRKTFVSIFPKWELRRKENVAKLNNIAETLHDEKKIINAVKIAGSAVGIVGGAAILTSIIFPPAAAVTFPAWLGGSAFAAFLPSCLGVAVPVQSAFAVAGGVAAASGGVSQLGTAVAEFALLNKHIEEAQTILEQDKELFANMMKWFKHTEEFREVMESLLNASIWKIVFDDFREFFNMARRIKNCAVTISKLTCFFPKMIAKIDKHRIFPPEYTIAIVGLLFVIFLIYRDNRILLSCILATINIVSACKVVEAGLKTAPAVTAMTTKGAMAGVKRAPEILFRDGALGAFAVLGMALDAVTLVLTTIDVSKGSKSEMGKKIEEASKKLNEEYEALNDVYRAIYYNLGHKVCF